MKRLLLISVFLSILFASCKKDDPDLVPEDNNYFEYYVDGVKKIPYEAYATYNSLDDFISIVSKSDSSQLYERINIISYNYVGVGTYEFPDKETVSDFDYISISIDTLPNNSYYTSYLCGDINNSNFVITDETIVDSLLDGTKNHISGTFKGDLCSGDSTKHTITGVFNKIALRVYK